MMCGRRCGRVRGEKKRQIVSARKPVRNPSIPLQLDEVTSAMDGKGELCR